MNWEAYKQHWADIPHVSIVLNGSPHTVKWLPDYGEIRIVVHNGKVTFVETTTKEKVE